jgi:hypothetical protein
MLFLRSFIRHRIMNLSFANVNILPIRRQLINLFIYLFCILFYERLKPLPKPVLHTVRPSAASFKIQYPPVSLRSSSSCLRLLPRLPITHKRIHNSVSILHTGI